MRHTRKGIGGSNPPLSASQSWQFVSTQHDGDNPRKCPANFRAKGKIGDTNRRSTSLFTGQSQAQSLARELTT